MNTVKCNAYVSSWHSHMLHLNMPRYHVCTTLTVFILMLNFDFTKATCKNKTKHNCKN
jgi:hypothetical protein